MRNWIVKIHMYGGLLCASYLIVFGISSLNFNHHFLPQEGEHVTWSRAVEIRPQENNRVLAETVRDSLGLMGWPFNWEAKREANGNAYVTLGRPARRYRIHILFDEGRVEVDEQRRGFLAAIVALHGHGGVPGSTYLGYWKIYTEICVWVVLFSAVSGVYLWTARPSERLIGYGLLGAAGITLLFMFYLWLWG